MPGSPFATGARFPIVIKYVEKTLPSGLTTVVVVKTAEMEERFKGSVFELQTQWVQPNWKESNDLIRASTTWDSEAGERMLDWQKYRFLLLEHFMKSWDVKDEKGQAVPCVKENIEKLDANIAAALVDEFLKKTTLTEKEVGN